MLHEQHSEALCSVISVSGMVDWADPCETTAPEEKPLKTPSPRGGRPEPVVPGRVHVQAGAVYSLEA